VGFLYCHGKEDSFSGDEGPTPTTEIHTINSRWGGKFNVTDNGTGDYNLPGEQAERFSPPVGLINRRKMPQRYILKRARS